MLPPGLRAHQAETELLSAEAPSVLWKVPQQPMNRRAGVLGKLEREAAHRTAPLDLTEAGSWVHLTAVTLPAPSLPQGPLPWPEASHPIGPAPQLPSEEPLSITEHVLHPKDFVRDVCHGTPTSKRKEAWIRGCASLLGQRYFQ